MWKMHFFSSYSYYPYALLLLASSWGCWFISHFYTNIPLLPLPQKSNGEAPPFEGDSLRDSARNFYLKISARNPLPLLLEEVMTWKLLLSDTQFLWKDGTFLRWLELQNCRWWFQYIYIYIYIHIYCSFPCSCCLLGKGSIGWAYFCKSQASRVSPHVCKFQSNKQNTDCSLARIVGKTETQPNQIHSQLSNSVQRYIWCHLVGSIFSKSSMLMAPTGTSSLRC